MAIRSTHFQFPIQTGFYQGKVRDVYTLSNGILIMIATDRISAFDVVLPEPIPFKGQVLNQIAAYFLEKTSSEVPNWFLDSPDPNVSIGLRCEPISIEMVVRGYLTGHSWRIYQSGSRNLCGVELPEGLKENDRFLSPILTPSTKESSGHDQDISRNDIIQNGIVSEEHYTIMEEYAYKLFELGTKMAAEKGLILVDTKYEFGLYEGKIYLMDEIHTPDSSRYFYADTYQELQDKSLPQKQLSKEFVRIWLMDNGFQGRPGEKIPEMNSNKIFEISERYVELYEKITGKIFLKVESADREDKLYHNILAFLKKNPYLSKNW